MNTELTRIRITPEFIRDRLIQDARKHYKRSYLEGLEKVPTEPREHHKRQHTVYVSPDVAKEAREGSACDCAYALAFKSVPGIFAAFILQRVAYTLERDEENKWAIYKFGTPDMARKRIVAFDKGRNMKPHTITFRPLPFSRTQKGVKIGKGTGAPKNRTVIKNRRNVASLLRMSMPEDLAA